MKKFEHASASQIRLYRRCNRKWYYNKIEGLPMPTSAAAELGKKLHTELENYLKFNVEPKSPIAKAGLHYLPAPGHDHVLYVEEKVEITNDLLPVPIIGFADLIEEFNGEVRITDHKTTSHFRNCKSPEELRTDPQAIIYGAHCFNEFDPPSGTVGFRHVYYNTKSPAARETEIRLSDEEIGKGLEGLTETVIAMAETANEIPGKIKTNPEACTDWGGCPFKARCAKAGNGPGGDYEALIKLANKEETVGKFSHLWSKKRETQGETKPEPAPVETEAAETTVETEAAETPAEELQGINPPDGVGKGHIGEIQMETTKPKRGGPFFSDGTRAKALKKDELFEKFSDETKGEIFNAHAAKLSAFKTRKEIIDFMEANAALFNSEAAPEPTPEPKPEPKKAPEQKQQLGGKKAIEKHPEVVEGEDTSPPKEQDLSNDCTLYVGCHPRKKAVVYFEELVRPIQEFVAQDADSIYYNTIPYSEGPKRVAAILYQKMKSGEIQMPENLVVDRRMPGADACLEVLIQWADSVVERIG